MSVQYLPSEKVVNSSFRVVIGTINPTAMLPNRMITSLGFLVSSIRHQLSFRCHQCLNLFKDNRFKHQ